jgi:hypothetical protein
MKRRDHIQVYRDYHVPLLAWETPTQVTSLDDHDDNATMIGETEEFFYQPYDF